MSQWLLVHSNLVAVMWAAGLCGLSSGVLGCFAFLRKRALIGDALAHAALPGVCLAFIISGGIKHPGLLMLGAMASGIVASWCLHAIVRYSRLKEDAAIGIILSVFFGVGIMLLTFIQHQPFGNQAGLDKFLFGQAAAMIGRDVWFFSIIAIVVLLLTWVARKELAVLCFDPQFGRAVGLPMTWIDHLLTGLMVAVITAGLQAVGVVLMAALLITPAAAARQWTDRLPVMLWIAGFCGAASGVGGTVISALLPRMPTGPWIVVCVTACFAVSLILAPRRGVLHRWWRQRKNFWRIQRENVLRTLYRLAEDSNTTAPTIDLLRRYRHLSFKQACQLLQSLQRDQLVITGAQASQWTLTESGNKRARRLVRRHRLWEVYLSKNLGMSDATVHRDAEEIEHVMTPELEAELEQLLGRPTHDPHNRTIPYDDEPGGDT